VGIAVNHEQQDQPEFYPCFTHWNKKLISPKGIIVQKKDTKGNERYDVSG
jgi:hypothetical protein